MPNHHFLEETLPDDLSESTLVQFEAFALYSFTCQLRIETHILLTTKSLEVVNGRLTNAIHINYNGRWSESVWTKSTHKYTNMYRSVFALSIPKLIKSCTFFGEKNILGKHKTCQTLKSPKFDLTYVSFPQAMFTFSFCCAALTSIEPGKKSLN